MTFTQRKPVPAKPLALLIKWPSARGSALAEVETLIRDRENRRRK